MIGATHYVALSLILLCIGLVGIMVRRNFITVLMSLELMFNAVNINLIAFSFRLGDLSGQVLAIFVITVYLVIAGILVLMTIFAAREAAGRTSRVYRGIMVDAWLAMAVSCFAVGAVVTQVVVGVEPWYEPRYVIPLIGMILGNSLTGIALAHRACSKSVDKKGKDLYQ